MLTKLVCQLVPPPCRVILKGFDLSTQHGCYMWGLNNSSNPRNMRETYSVGWCFFQVGSMSKVSSEVAASAGSVL